MREAAYGSMLANDIEKEIGGKVIKISDRSTLGLPDSMHLLKGIVTFIETKIAKDHEIIDGITYVQPWKFVQNDIRQYEVCKAVSKGALVLYAAYYPKIKSSVIIPVEYLAQFRPLNHAVDFPWLSHSSFLRKGRGIEQLKHFMNINKKGIYEDLGKNYRAIS